MNPEQFCYWLQGFGELNGSPPTDEQWKAINEHLALVFKKVTPSSPGYITPPPFTPLPTYVPPTILPYQADPTRITCAAKPSKAIAGVLTC